MKLVLAPVALSLTLALTACSGPDSAPAAGTAPSLTPVASPAPVAAPVPTAAGPSPVTAAAGSVPEAQAAPTPAAAKPPATAAERDGKSGPAGKSGLEVRRLVLASRVVEREPELALEPRVNEPLLAFVEAKNGAAEEEHLIVTFEHESGTKVGFVQLSVPAGAKRFRTWARTRNLKEPGNWVAVVRSEAGEELGRTAFTVTEG